MQQPPFTWLPRATQPAFPAGPLGKLISFEGSLTGELTRLGRGDFQLQLLRQMSGVTAAPDVPVLRELPAAQWLPAVQREVLMFCAGRAVVPALTLIPMPTAERHGWIDALGARSLGHALFERRDVQRSEFEFIQLPMAQGWLCRVLDSVDGASVPATGYCWARRSVFRVDGDPLLVTEAFLPAVEGLLPAAVREGASS